MFKARNFSNGDILSFYTDSDYNALNTIDVQDIRNIIDKKHVIEPRFRFRILNDDETPRMEIPEGDIILGGNYNENYQNGQRRSLSFSLHNAAGKYTPSINFLWTDTKLSFEMGLMVGDVVVWFPKGIFIITNISTTHRQGEKTVNIEAGDKFALLESANGTIETTYTIPVGSIAEDVINDLLLMDRGNGVMMDTKPITYDSSFKGFRTQATIEVSAGQTIGSIILELATQLSAEVFYDVYGSLNFVPINYVTNDTDKAITYEYTHDEISNDDISFNMDGIINRIIIIGATVNNENIYAVAVNDNYESPFCYQRIGYRTASPISDNNITSNTLAKERADYELRQKLILKSTISNGVRYNPLLMVNTLIMLTDDFYDFLGERLLIQSISCPIDYSGSMEISSSNIKNFTLLTGSR